MAHFIIYKDGAYNLYDDISGRPKYQSARTQDELWEVVLRENSSEGVRLLPERLARAHLTGCSDLGGMTLKECISCNRAGISETTVPFEAFVAKYLTIYAGKSLADKTHEGFEIICKRCGGNVVVVESNYGGSPQSGTWGGVSLKCCGCQKSTTIWGED